MGMCLLRAPFVATSDSGSESEPSLEFDSIYVCVCRFPAGTLHFGLTGNHRIPVVG